MELRPRTEARLIEATTELNEVTRAAAERYDVLCLPVAGHPALRDPDTFSADGLHPSSAGHRFVAEQAAIVLHRTIRHRVRDGRERSRGMILEGKKILVTGVVNRHSIAFAIAERAQAQGAEVLLTSFGRVKRMTERSAARLDPAPEVLELDVNSDEDIAALTRRAEGALGHRRRRRPRDRLRPRRRDRRRLHGDPAGERQGRLRDQRLLLQGAGRGVAPLMDGGGALVGLDFDATVAWPSYDWMGVAKAALESVNRYLAKDLGPQGIRANLISAGPVHTAAASGISGFSDLEASGATPRRSAGTPTTRPRSPTRRSSCSAT